MTEQDTSPELYQVRILLRADFAEAVSRKERPEEIQALFDILDKHGARIDHDQYEEFTNFLEDVKKGNPTRFGDHELKRMEAMTQAVVDDPVKSSYLKREFTLSVKGQVDALFQGTEGDALIKDLQTLGVGPILTSGMNFKGAGVRKVPAPKGDHPVPDKFKHL